MPVKSDESAAASEARNDDSNDNNNTNATTPGSIASVAGKKRKSTASSRGVATLTPEQLEKKRANDREAQRAIRERTKNQIESLESRIRELESQQPFQELQAVQRQKQAIQAENEEIRKRLSNVLAIIQPILGAQSLTGMGTPTAQYPRLTGPLTQLNTELASSVPIQSTTDIPWKQSTNPKDGQGYAQDAQDGPRPQRNSDASSYTLETSSPRTGTAHRRSLPGARGHGSFSEGMLSPFDSQKNNLTHGLDFGASGEKLGLGFLLDPSQQVTKLKDIQRESERVGSHGSYTQFAGQHVSTFTDPPRVAHAALCLNIPPTCPLDGLLLDFLHARQRDLAEGASSQRLVGPSYPSVSSLLNPERSHYSHPLSKLFTDVLSKFPDISTLPEQVAVLYIMFLIMRWQIYPTQENYDRLPEWATPRPSQLFTPHPAWIDYLPWPRMRDKMVATHQNYVFENWFIPFTTTLSLNWPYEPTDCLLLSSETDELMINPVFERHLRNLGNWSLGPAWARAYPELVETARIKGDTRRSSDDASASRLRA